MLDDNTLHEELSAATNLTNAAFENLRESVFIIDDQNCIVYANRHAMELMGKTPQTLYGKDLLSFLHGYQEQNILALLWQIETTRYGDKFNVFYATHTQGMIPAEVCTSRFIYQQRQHATVVICDTRHRNDLHRFYYERENSLRGMLKNVPDVMLRVDMHLRCLYANEAAQYWLDYVDAPLVGQALRNVLENSQLFQQIALSVRSVAQSGKRFENVLRKLSGTEESILQLRFIPEFNDRHMLESVLITGQDITRQFKDDQLLKRTHEQLRQMTRQIQVSVENERKHIAREIHDELGQRLSTLRMVIALIHDEGRECSEQMQTLKDIVDGTIRVVRDLSTILRPAVLNMGLVPALRWLCDESNKYHRDCRYTLEAAENEIALSDEHTTAIFRVVQESLTNVYRHARASRVHITVAQTGSLLSIDVSDNGRGFDVDSVPTTAFGLLGMRERCTMLGWELRITSQPGQGSQVRITGELPSPH
ncbi:hypothetical protein ED28_16135 [[Pantoea] beijingensis]|uniref:Histidine kinase n=1 Tax=[Pantoea] beijingensis TaxID=1324864 RepID=A0A443IAQ2_9GAMM|nr:PAS domain-containing protein [[Pantoea] beijingensis]RWR00977.1 hypothetical protein ED28_16135 [[Pantoea] beijingensis]